MSVAVKRLAFAASHLSNIRIFALWGILDALVYLLAKGNRIKSMIVYFTIFITITIVAFHLPEIMDFL
jgi:hypothetical protein